MDPIKFLEALSKFIIDLLGSEFYTKYRNHILIIASLIVFYNVVITLFKGISELLKSIKEISIFSFSSERKKSLETRNRFIDFLEYELVQIGHKENWHDYNFTELEAELEVDQKKEIKYLGLFKRQHTSKKREPSLTIALQNNKERLIHLIGDPGSGKSISLRHLALNIAKKTKKSKDLNKPIPLYINLKEFNPKDKPIDSNAIRSFILHILNRPKDRDIDDYLEREFKKGLLEGKWLLLFDSFDEIPAILSSTESDSIVNTHIHAIHDFLHSMNKCRGIIASRYFRGPNTIGWPTFKILPLTIEKQKKLIVKQDFNKKEADNILQSIKLATDDIQIMSSNPMFLNLLCDHLKSNMPFPENSYTLYESYFNRRIDRDLDRINKKFGIGKDEVIQFAQHVAYTMAIEDGLGLSPSKSELKKSLLTVEFYSDSLFEKCLSALEYIKIIKSEVYHGDNNNLVTFTHRRFQEYFVTKLILKKKHLVSNELLITDERWRESAIVLLQTQNIQDISDILELIYNKLEIAKSTLKNNYLKHKNILSIEYIVPSDIYHILDIVQNSFSGRINKLPKKLTDISSWLIKAIFKHGSFLEKKWAVDIIGALNDQDIVKAIKIAFTLQSEWVNDSIYKHIAKINPVPKEIKKEIRLSLIDDFYHNRLSRKSGTLNVYFNRLEDSSDLSKTLNLLKILNILDIFSICLSIFIFYKFTLHTKSNNYFYALFIINSLLLTYFYKFIRNIKNFNFRDMILNRFYIYGFCVLFSIYITTTFVDPNPKADINIIDFLINDIKNIDESITMLDFLSNPINLAMLALMLIAIYLYVWGAIIFYSILTGELLSWWGWPFALIPFFRYQFKDINIFKKLSIFMSLIFLLIFILFKFTFVFVIIVYIAIIFVLIMTTPQLIQFLIDISGYTVDLFLIKRFKRLSINLNVSSIEICINSLNTVNGFNELTNYLLSRNDNRLETNVADYLENIANKLHIFMTDHKQENKNFIQNIISLYKKDIDIKEYKFLKHYRLDHVDYLSNARDNLYKLILIIRSN